MSLLEGPSAPGLAVVPRLRIRFAEAADMQDILRLRHDVYAEELGQHERQAEGTLRDWVDEVNLYLVAEVEGDLAGFISVTPPNPRGYSVDKYFPRATLPFRFHDRLYEVRLLTVVAGLRGQGLAQLLMMAALRVVQMRGGTSVMAIGRIQLLPMYQAAGLQPLGKRVKSGAVEFELLHAETRVLAERAAQFCLTNPWTLHVDWPDRGLPQGPRPAIHGGRSFEAIGASFDDPGRKEGIIAADVLDAWFLPAPRVLRTLQDHLAWSLKASPPVGTQGIEGVIAQARGVPAPSILVGPGSSDLIHRAVRQWLRPGDTVLTLDPTYSEYPHVLALAGCRVDRLELSASEDFRLSLGVLREAAKGHDWVFLVNPNNPTGQHLGRTELEAWLREIPATTRVWVDETYVDYVDSAESLEAFATSSRNVVVCKSMSKAYALSGARVAYLCGPPPLLAELRVAMPPWSVGTVAQLAACEALRGVAHYEACWTQTRHLAQRLAEGLGQLGWKVFPSGGNFLLCQIPAGQPSANELLSLAATKGLFLRATTGMGAVLGEGYVRVTVLDGATNERMLSLLSEVLAPTRQASPPSLAKA